MDYEDLCEETSLDVKNNCQVLWEEVIQPSLTTKNPANFHSCCSTISTRSLTKAAEHVETESISKFLKRNGIANADDFNKWFREDLVNRVNAGLPGYALTINTKHPVLTKEKLDMKENDLEKQYWKRRVDFKNDRLYEYEKKVSKLEETIEELKDKIKKYESNPKKMSPERSRSRNNTPNRDQLPQSKSKKKPKKPK